MCREPRRVYLRDFWKRSNIRRDDADQVEIRGGWSGGAPMRPSAVKSTRAKESLRVWKETWIPFVGDGPTWAIVNMHIATSGQS
jgi:hypothetical protein